MTQYPGPHTFSSDEHFRGQVAGDATISSGAKVTIHGQVTGDLHVETGATLRLPGMVCGVIYNSGGDVEVTGAYGGIVDDGATVSRIDAKAMKLG